ncbi:hypothetical protein NY99_14375 [Xanthomonas phaseoli pv. phaseoli]|nr:hypothetical protein NY99_14375 [Xanthomonas phaseoli pv. phaseoli]KKY05511.1 hypothetical protein RM61_24000 [Xanthomonas phaseoli pv. phaseoli]KKY07530.1 hypothetical protein RM60_24665 [Xanthomonas phaseoli pv. phaseoli]KKY07844.1 hypothetical protein QQ30_25985 [Xanthomonas phaseoli pv. phaseoli]
MVRSCSLGCNWLPCAVNASLRDGPSEHHTDSRGLRPFADVLAHGIGDARQAGRAALRRPHHAPARPPSLQRRLRISA